MFNDTITFTMDLFVVIDSEMGVAVPHDEDGNIFFTTQHDAIIYRDRMEMTTLRPHHITTHS